MSTVPQLQGNLDSIATVIQRDVEQVEVPERPLGINANDGLAQDKGNPLFGNSAVGAQWLIQARQVMLLG